MSGDAVGRRLMVFPGATSIEPAWLLNGISGFTVGWSDAFFGFIQKACNG